MGVHDYECRYCGVPQSYDCKEDEGGPCRATGLGNDEAVLELFVFKREGAPSSLEEFARRRGEALRRERRAFRYDWGDWEFEPSLNYRAVLMGETADRSYAIWRMDLSAQTEGGEVEWDEHSPIGIPYSRDELVWVVNACPVCAKLFDEGEDSEPLPCKLLFDQVAEYSKAELPEEMDRAGKLAFLRERFAGG